MKVTIYGLFIALTAMSCSNNATSDNHTAQQPNSSSASNMKYQLSEELNGLWISEDYLKKIGVTLSVYQSKDYETDIQGFYLDEKNLQSDSAMLDGFTPHEGGYSSPLVYDSTQHKFVNNLSKTEEYTVFPDPFELNYDSAGILNMYFPKSKKTDKYRKLSSDLQTELRKILIADKYKSGVDGSAIQFDKDGTVHNFEDYRYYELIYDFQEGIEYDAILFFKSLQPGGNWVDGDLYAFKRTPKNLELQSIKPNWETMEHSISKKVIMLELQ